jgi:hypothetical protein
MSSPNLITATAHRLCGVYSVSLFFVSTQDASWAYIGRTRCVEQLVAPTLRYVEVNAGMGLAAVYKESTLLL